ncbi:hypothetical protein H9L39_01480 [Fusarium oxysporum f. sp. albedinis]|nr:hypothetical protein H9L39_01480 [Fusarium oxysporum f. sp. albedinis]
MRFCAVPKEPTLESFSGVAGGSTTFWALLGVAGGRALEGARGLKKRLAAACTWQTGRSGFAPLKKLRLPNDAQPEMDL